MSDYDKGQRKAQTGEAPTWRDSQSVHDSYEQAQSAQRARDNHKAEMASQAALNRSIRDSLKKQKDESGVDFSPSDEARNARGFWVGVVIFIAMAYGFSNQKDEVKNQPSDARTNNTQSSSNGYLWTFNCTAMQGGVHLRYAPNEEQNMRKKGVYFSIDAASGVRIDMGEIARQSKSCNDVLLRLKQQGIVPK